jgi:DNA-binding CsgD family transcriptional regulator
MGFRRPHHLVANGGRGRPLTQREFEMLRLLLAEKTIKNIAEIALPPPRRPVANMRYLI